MKILATMDNITEISYKLSQCKDFYTIDTETYGLAPYTLPFSIIIDNGYDTIYLNQNPNGPDNAVLSYKIIVELLDMLDTTKETYFHNAPFDVIKLLNIGYTVSNPNCVMQLFRLLDNTLMSYQLKALAKHVGMQKSDEVEAYIKKHKLIEKVGDVTNKRYDLVPFKVMFDYACIDTDVTRALVLYLKQNLGELSKFKPLDQIIKQESDIILPMCRVIRKGVLIDIAKAEKNLVVVNAMLDLIDSEVMRMTGEKYSESPKFLTRALESQGVTCNLSEKGNPILDKAFLKTVKNPISTLVLRHRSLIKVREFHESILEKADHNGRIYPNFRLANTKTGRLSCEDPNIQQFPKKALVELKEAGVDIRGLVLPDSSDHAIVMMDFDQMEYRLSTDYSGNQEMATEVNNGMCCHTYTARELDITRDLAKTVNFGKLYGMGVAKLMTTLGLSEEEGRKINAKYNQKFHKVVQLSRQINTVAQSRGYIFNRYGRPYKNLGKFNYKLLNYLVQGTGADVVRQALIKCDALLQGTSSRIMMQVHDEIVFSIHKNDLHLIEPLNKIMREEYKPVYTDIKLTVGIDYSTKSWSKSDAKPYTGVIE